MVPFRLSGYRRHRASKEHGVYLMKNYAGGVRSSKDVKHVNEGTKQQKENKQPIYDYGYKRAIYILIGTIIFGLSMIMLLKLMEIWP